jgi:hypothetical protein
MGMYGVVHLGCVEEMCVDLNGSTGTEDAQHPDEPRMSDEDARRLVEQLRSTSAEQVITGVFSTLLEAAEVKLGRRDARLFIDLCAVMVEHARDYVAEDLGHAVEQALGQLRFAQVSAETQVAKSGASEPNDLKVSPRPPSAQQPPSGGRSTSPSSQL